MGHWCHSSSLPCYSTTLSRELEHFNWAVCLWVQGNVGRNYLHVCCLLPMVLFSVYVKKANLLRTEYLKQTPAFTERVLGGRGCPQLMYSKFLSQHERRIQSRDIYTVQKWEQDLYKEIKVAAYPRTRVQAAAQGRTAPTPLPSGCPLYWVGGGALIEYTTEEELGRVQCIGSFLTEKNLIFKPTGAVWV